MFAGAYPGMEKIAEAAERTIAEKNEEKTKSATNILLMAQENCTKLRSLPGQVTYHGLPAEKGASGPNSQMRLPS
jgi:hypothetical protein